MRPPNIRRLSRRLIFSYVLDWIVMVAILGVGGGFSYIDAKSARHAFSLQDPSISYPHVHELISSPVLYVASVVLPAVIIAVTCLIVVPGPANLRSFPSSAALWRRKLWELNVGWLGLALSAFGALLITNGLKPLTGKPRPYLLSICNPDLSADAIHNARVGGLGGDDLSSAIAPIIVTWQICQNTNKADLKDAFASWPSGHASTSWSGLFYLFLFFCAKFGLKLPSLWSFVVDPRRAARTSTQDHELRNEAAAPPAYLVLFAALPIGTAFFISISRWFDYRHHGFDIICGAIIGILCAWFSFHFYHVPIGVSDGWAWAPRARGQVFGLLAGGDSGYGTAVDETGRRGESSDGGSVQLGQVNIKNDVENQDLGRVQGVENNDGRSGLDRS